jgi:hypothetical protein
VKHFSVFTTNFCSDHAKATERERYDVLYLPSAAAGLAVVGAEVQGLAVVGAEVQGFAVVGAAVTGLAVVVVRGAVDGAELFSSVGHGVSS